MKIEKSENGGPAGSAQEMEIRSRTEKSLLSTRKAGFFVRDSEIQYVPNR